MQETLLTTDKLEKQLQEQNRTLHQLHGGNRLALALGPGTVWLSWDSSSGSRLQLGLGLGLGLSLCLGWDQGLD